MIYLFNSNLKGRGDRSLPFLNFQILHGSQQCGSCRKYSRSRCYFLEIFEVFDILLLGVLA